MPLETATYLSDLVPTNPVQTDGVAQGDDHLRLIKETLQATFPNITGPVTATQDSLNNNGVPIGGIIMWSGALGDVPLHWAVCNGLNGTPDLRDKFIYGAGNVNPGTTGGASSNTLSTSNDGAHSHNGATGSAGGHGHTATSTATSTSTSTASSTANSNATSTATSSASTTGTVAGHALSLAEMPAHDHGLGGKSVLANWTPQTWTLGGGADVPAAAFGAVSQGSGQAHSHSWSGSTSVTTSVNTSVSTTVNTNVDTTTNTSVSTGISTVADHWHTIPVDGSTHAHSLTVPCVPVYYALAFIMRIS